MTILPDNKKKKDMLEIMLKNTNCKYKFKIFWK